MNSQDQNLRDKVQQKIAAVEFELKKIGAWQTTPLKPEQYDFRKAFAMDTMAYEQWIQFILIPRVQEILATNEEFPSQSMVGAQAIREFDGRDEMADLITLLCEFDQLF